MAERLIESNEPLAKYAKPLRRVILEMLKENPDYVMPPATIILNNYSQIHENLLATSRKQLVDNRAEIAKDLRLNDTERALLLKQSDIQIAIYTAHELHGVYIADNVTVRDLKNKIDEFDSDFGESFKKSAVRKHYEDQVRVVAYWNYAKQAVKGLPAHTEDIANLPDFNTEQGQLKTSLIDLLWGMRDVHREITDGTPGQRLLDVMTRLDKSDNEYMYIDRRNGDEVIRNLDGVYVKKDDRSVEVAKVNIGIGYVTAEEKYKDETDGTEVIKDRNGNFVKERSGTVESVPKEKVASDGHRAKIVVDIKLTDGPTVYVSRDRLKLGDLRNSSLHRFGDIVLGKDIIEVYDYGRTPSEKIYSPLLDPAKISEIEITAQRLADAMAEKMTITKEETEVFISKSKGRLSGLGLPNTPMQDKFSRWSGYHGLIQKVHNTRHFLSQDSVDSLPDTLMDLTQKLKPKTIELSNGKKVTLTIDKKGNWGMLFGTTWTERAKLTRDDVLELGGSHNQVIGATMPYDRMRQAADVIDETVKIIQDKVYYGTDDLFKSWASGAISRYSKPEGEKRDLFVRTMRELTPREVVNIQQGKNAELVIKETIEKVRSFLGWHEFLAWKVSPLFIEQQGWVKGYTAEHRGRQIFNEIFAMDEAVINDPLVGSDKWKNEVINNLYEKSRDNFTGGIVLEQWLKSYKRFQEGKDGLGVIDSNGITRAIKFEEVLQFLGMETYEDTYKAEDGKTILRRRLKMITPTQGDDLWQKYLDKKNNHDHGVDSNVAISLREFFNTGNSPIVPTKGSSLFGEVLPPYFDVTDLFKVKYAAVDWFLEHRYPYRMWGDNALSEFQKRINRQPAINEHGNEIWFGGIISKPWSEYKYRWGYVFGREPLHLWEAALRMSSQTRLEIAPDTKYIESKKIGKNGNAIESASNDLDAITVYRVGNTTYIDPVLRQMGITNLSGFATKNTLLAMARKDALSLETIEYGTGDYVEKKSAGYGATRPPIDLARRALQIKVPFASVVHSFEYQKRVVIEDVSARLGIDPKTEEERLRKILNANVALEWDRQNRSLRVATPTDIFFQYSELLQSEKITVKDFISLCDMAGCHMRLQFDHKGQMLITRGQGAAFVEGMKHTGLEDKFLAEMLKQNAENATKIYQNVATLLTGYFIGKGTPFLSEFVAEATKASAKGVSAFARNAALPAVAATVSTLISVNFGEQILSGIGLANGTAWTTFGAFFASYGLALGYAAYQTHLINSNTYVSGKIINGTKYVERWAQSKTSRRSTLRAHEAGCAIWNGSADSVVEDVDDNKGGKLYERLQKLYDASWAAAHGVAAPAN